jgi:hypothetical protein
MPMPSLLERQQRLAEFLSDPKQYNNAAEAERLARELDIAAGARLGAAGTMAANKRLGKIHAVLPKTMEILGPGARHVFDGFAHHYPPTSISRADNAHQFMEYLEQAEDIEAPEYILDVAKFEITRWRIIVMFDPAIMVGIPIADSLPSTVLVRRAPPVALIVLDHDVRCLFEGDGDGSRQEPDRRLVYIAMSGQGEGLPPRVFELDACLYDAVGRMEGWKTAASWSKEFATIEVPDIEALHSIGLIEFKS